jgi:hypothetical protein
LLVYVAILLVAHRTAAPIARESTISRSALHRLPTSPPRLLALLPIRPLRVVPCAPISARPSSLLERPVVPPPNPACLPSLASLPPRLLRDLLVRPHDDSLLLNPVEYEVHLPLGSGVTEPKVRNPPFPPVEGAEQSMDDRSPSASPARRLHQSLKILGGTDVGRWLWERQPLRVALADLSDLGDERLPSRSTTIERGDGARYIG